MNKQPLSRRERYHATTREEAKNIALRQLAEGGIGAISLNAIGKEMGITGPALYRYFDSRDALLSNLIVDTYTDLAVAVEAAMLKNDQGTPGESLRALAAAVRVWALTQPHRYLLIYGTPVPGYTAPDDTVPLARRVLTPFLNALDTLPMVEAPLGSRLSTLELQLATWAGVTGQHAAVLRRGLIWWTRLHGLISLEVEGHFSSMGFDPALFYDTEVDALLDNMGAV